MKRKSLTQAQIEEVPTAHWYEYKLECGFQVFSKVRIVVPKDYSYQEHLIQCPVGHTDRSSQWEFIVGMKTTTQDEVDLYTLEHFITPGRILRSGNPNPYPYSIGKNRDY